MRDLTDNLRKPSLTGSSNRRRVERDAEPPLQLVALIDRRHEWSTASQAEVRSFKLVISHAIV
jgi:hypothetical protein